jgi:hypothetical protein
MPPLLFLKIISSRSDHASRTDWCDDNGPRVVEWTAVLARSTQRLNVGDMGRCIPIARMRPVKMCPVLSFSRGPCWINSLLALIAFDMFGFSPSGWPCRALLSQSGFPTRYWPNMR